MRAAFTIFTPSYISYAKTLADSILKYNPEYKVFMCLLGSVIELNQMIDLSHFQVVELDILKDESIISMKARYSPFDLSCALKPFFASFILTKYPEIKRLKYFDSDIMLFGAFDRHLESDSSSIFLTPHFFKPVSLKTHGQPNDSDMLQAGIFNAGFFEVSQSYEAHNFLNWWKGLTEIHCSTFKPPYQHILGDQSWLVLVPIYFRNVKIIHHLGYNTSFYNLHERAITVQNQTYHINVEEQLIFFHYTGYKHFRHHLGSSLHSKFTYSNTPFLKDICEEYLNKLLYNNVNETYPNSIQVPLPDNNNNYGSFYSKLINFPNRLLSKFFKNEI